MGYPIGDPCNDYYFNSRLVNSAQTEFQLDILWCITLMLELTNNYTGLVYPVVGTNMNLPMPNDLNGGDFNIFRLLH